MEVPTFNVACLLSAHPVSPHGVYTAGVVSPLEELLSESGNTQNPQTDVESTMGNCGGRERTESEPIRTTEISTSAAEVRPVYSHTVERILPIDLRQKSQKPLPKKPGF